MYKQSKRNPLPAHGSTSAGITLEFLRDAFKEEMLSYKQLLKDVEFDLMINSSTFTSRELVAFGEKLKAMKDTADKLVTDAHKIIRYPNP